MSEDRAPDAHRAAASEGTPGRGRIWLIVGLVIAIVAVAAVVLLFVLPRSGDTAPTQSPTPAVSTPTGSAEPSPSPSDDPSPTPQPTELEPAAQRIDDQLGEALADLDAISDSPADVSLGIVDELQDAAQRLSDSLPGAGIEDAYDELQAYSAALTDVRSALADGGSVTAALETARSALSELREAVRA